MWWFDILINVFVEIFDPENLYFDTGIMTICLIIPEIATIIYLAAMFFKMAAKYGRCDSLTYSKMFPFNSLTLKTYTLTLESEP